MCFYNKSSHTWNIFLGCKDAVLLHSISKRKHIRSIETIWLPVPSMIFCRLFFCFQFLLISASGSLILQFHHLTLKSPFLLTGPPYGFIFSLFWLCRDKNLTSKWKLRLRYKVYLGISLIGKEKRKCLNKPDKLLQFKPNFKSGTIIIFFQTHNWTQITTFWRFCEI